MSDDEKSDVADAQSRCARYADIELEDGELRGPLAGLFPSGLAVPTLKDALAPLGEILPGFAWDSTNVKIALKKAKKVQKQYSFMTLDEIPSIVLYTMEAVPREESLYFALNKSLRAKDRSGVKPWRDYIWLLLNSLKKLPASNILNVVRGAKLSPEAMKLDLSEGDEFTWAGFSSVTTSVEVMETFLGSAGNRTMLQIQFIEKIGRDIKDFSLYPSEKELLLPPNICFEFTGSFKAGGGLVIIQAKQTETVDPILNLGERCDGEVAGSGAKAAKMLNPEVGKEVRQFLEEADLAQFANAFIEEGFDSLDMLTKLSEDELKELGLKLGHKKKFLEAVAGKLVFQETLREQPPPPPWERNWSERAEETERENSRERESPRDWEQEMKERIASKNSAERANAYRTTALHLGTVELEGLVMHLPLNPTDPTQDVVGNFTIDFRDSDVDVVDGAIEFSGSQRLLLQTPVEVGAAWTIAAWFRTPMPVWDGYAGFQNLCANDSFNGGHVVLDGGKLGLWISAGSPSGEGGGGTTYCSPECNLIELLTDLPGWHHLAGVGVDGKTLFYLDGEYVGEASKQNRDPLGVIGHMYPDGDLPESWGGAMKHFMLFDYALPHDAVFAMFEHGHNYHSML